jgi:hypothetical protein
LDGDQSHFIPLFPAKVHIGPPATITARVDRLNSRPAAERVGATMLAWNAAETGQDGVRESGTLGVAARDNGATRKKAPRADEEAGYGAATGATE